MSREFKPGDVAMAQNEHGVWDRAILQVHPLGERWVYGVAHATRSVDWADVRPLAVIDPEDPEQVERLLNLYAAQWTHLPRSECDFDSTPTMQAALREFASPKPPEPTGLGAVVESADGRQWVRALPDGGPAKWRLVTLDGRIDPWAVWSAIPAVRILSPGYVAAPDAP